MNVPEWVRQHNCSLMEGTDGKSWYLVLGEQPQYRLVPTPAAGRYGCSIVQTVNGRRIPSDSRADSRDGAVAAGLNDLGKYLGWVG